MAPRATKPWFVYLVRCADLSIYTGITDNVTTRIEKHNNGRGARYTAQRRPVALIYQEEHPDQGSAMKREAQIKTWPKARKEKLAIDAPTSRSKTSLNRPRKLLHRC
jgi:predicted GIY-YIG superfamily endonuclease